MARAKAMRAFTGVTKNFPASASSIQAAQWVSI